MKINLGLVERAVRAVLGLVLIGLAASGYIPGIWMWVTGVVGVVLLATAAISFCPLWAMLGISTAPKDKA
jgi:hypothetical protein